MTFRQQMIIAIAHLQSQDGLCSIFCTGCYVPVAAKAKAKTDGSKPTTKRK